MEYPSSLEPTLHNHIITCILKLYAQHYFRICSNTHKYYVLQVFDCLRLAPPKKPSYLEKRLSYCCLSNITVSISLLVAFCPKVRLRLQWINATFNNISVISWRSALLVEETGESTDLPQVTDKQIFVSSTLRHKRESNPQRQW